MRRGVGLGAVKRDDGAWGLATRPFAKTFEDTDEDGCERERAGKRRNTGMRGAHPREGEAPKFAEALEPRAKRVDPTHMEGNKKIVRH